MIPASEYGGGTALVRDRGEYDNLSRSGGEPASVTSDRTLDQIAKDERRPDAGTSKA